MNEYMLDDRYRDAESVPRRRRPGSREPDLNPPWARKSGTNLWPTPRMVRMWRDQAESGSIVRLNHRAVDVAIRGEVHGSVGSELAPGSTTRYGPGRNLHSRVGADLPRMGHLNRHVRIQPCA